MGALEREQQEYDTVCPSCGAFAPLEADTGWCISCTAANVPAGICLHCKRHFPPDGNRRVCSTCRKKDWFYTNGDKLDRLLASGLTIATAVKYVTVVNKPSCLCCGNVIRNGTSGRVHFCARTAACRKAARRLRYYRVDKGLSAQDALEKVKESLVKA